VVRALRRVNLGRLERTACAVDRPRDGRSSATNDELHPVGRGDAEEVQGGFELDERRRAVVAEIHAAEHAKKQAVPLLVMRDGTTYYLALELRAA